MRCLFPASIAIAAMLASPAAAQVTVQQPAVRSFGGFTTVSVPDRGRAHLGSVNSAAASRSWTGPFRSGTSLGLEARGSSLSAGVFIHDLREMDEALLAKARASTSTKVWEQRLAERRGSQSASPATRHATPVNRAADYEALARRAEERGKASVAQVYWRMAAKEGSALAQSKLAELKPSLATAAKSAR